jgi:multidrug transporter EmrE-like cation transporter
MDAIIKSMNFTYGGLKMLPIFFASMMTLVDIFMMTSVKLITIGKLPNWVFGLSMLSYGLQPMIFIQGTRSGGMALSNLIWNLMSNIVIAAIGVFYFGEKMRGVKWVGVGMGLFAMILLSWDN